VPVRLTSPKSPRVSQIRRLRDRTVRRSTGLFLAEGPELVRAALHADAVEELWATEQWLGEFSADIIATEQVLRAAAHTEHPQGVLAVCRQPSAKLTDIWAAPGQVVVLDRIADPGNLGTIVRTAAAVGAAGVVLLPECVDPFNAKAVRSTAGAIFQVPIVSDVSVQSISALDGRTLIATKAGGGQSPFALAAQPRPAWLIGSEAHGLAPEVAALAQTQASIPMVAGVESLNAAVAAAICLYAGFAGTDTPRMS
jgi:RNA methyltransferase, TrmH family